MVGETILVVDDRLAAVFAATLEIEGEYKVIQAFSMADALKKYDQNKENIAAIVTDLSMDHGNGDELIRALRVRGVQIPIILNSHEVNAASVVQALNTAGHNVIHFNDKAHPENLVAQVQNAIASPQHRGPER